MHQPKREACICASECRREKIAKWWINHVDWQNEINRSVGWPFVRSIYCLKRLMLSASFSEHSQQWETDAVWAECSVRSTEREKKGSMALCVSVFVHAHASDIAVTFKWTQYHFHWKMNKLSTNTETNIKSNNEAKMTVLLLLKNSMHQTRCSRPSRLLSTTTSRPLSGRLMSITIIRWIRKYEEQEKNVKRDGIGRSSCRQCW